MSRRLVVRLGLALAVVVVAVAVVPLATVPSAAADGVADEADLQFQLGADAYAAGNYRGALEHFLASNRLVPNRNVMFNIARAFEQLGRFPDAYRYYVDALRGETSATTQRELEASIARVSPRVAIAVVDSSPPGATVYVDRRDLGSVGTTGARLGLATGTYRFLLELPGYHPVEVGPFELRAGTRTPISATLTPIVGTVVITGAAGAEVRVDDEGAAAACRLPCELALAPGTHTLYFASAGARAAPRTVAVTADQRSTVEASFTVDTGSILVSADETGARVEVDGALVGFTPTVVTGVAVGTRAVRVSLRGFESVERSVEVRADQQLDLSDVELEPLRQVSAASRDTERIEDAPASVTVIEADELAAFAYPTILEALRGVRGFAVNYDSIYGNAAVRGLGQANDYNNRLLVLSDGAVLNENVLYQPFIHYDGRVDLGDVERIEIVRGPASVLYGTGAVSGVVNLVLRGKDSPTGARAQMSSYDGSTARTRADATYRAGEVGGWLSLGLARSGGRDATLIFDDGTGADAPQVAHAYDRFTAWTVAGKAWWKGFGAQVFYTDRRLTVPTGSFGAVFDDPRNFSDDRRFLTEVKYDGAVAKRARLLLRGYLNWAYYHQDAQFDATVDPNQPFIQNYQETYRSWWVGAEARLTLELARGVKLAFGAEATLHTDVAMHTGQYERDGSFTPILDVDAPYQVVAGYALLDWRLGPRAALQAGARLDYWNLEGNQLAEAGDDNVVTAFPALSPRVALVTKPSPRDVVKVMAGTGFRAPSAFEYYYADGGSSQAASSVCGETLDPENVYSGELEARHRFSRDWSAVAAVHGTYADRIIETVSVPTEARCGNDAGQVPEGVGYYRNSPVGELILGGDVELRREWRAGVMLSVHYGYLRPRYLERPDPSISDRALPNAPTHFAALKAAVPIVPDLATGALRVSFEDRRRIDTDSAERTRRAVVADLVISGAVGRQGVRYAAGLYNLFDWQYALPSFPYASNLMPQAGRSLVLSLSYVR